MFLALTVCLALCQLIHQYYLFFGKKIIYSFTFAVLGLCCCVRTFSRYSEWVLLSMGTLYSPWVCRLLIVVASLIAKCGL